MIIAFLKNNWFKLSILVLAIATAIQIMIAFSQLSVSVEQNRLYLKTDNINPEHELESGGWFNGNSETNTLFPALNVLRIYIVLWFGLLLSIPFLNFIVK